MIPPFALHVARAFELRGELWLEGSACGRAPGPGDSLVIQSPLSPTIPVRIRSRAGTPRGATTFQIVLGVANLPELCPAQYVGAHVTEEGAVLVPLSARIRRHVSTASGISTVRFELANETRWGFAQISDELVVFHVLGGGRLVPGFWSEFRRCIFDDGRSSLTRGDLVPFVEDSPLSVRALRVLERTAGSLFVKPIGPVLNREAWVVIDDQLDLVPVYQQPSGPIQFRVSSLMPTEPVLLIAA